MNLFNEEEKEVIRTIGLYQPYGSAMLHDKIETRWVMAGKKAPFPLGKYLIYTTKKPATEAQILEWSGLPIKGKMDNMLSMESTQHLHGCAIAIGNLVKVTKQLLDPLDSLKTYVHGSTIMHKYIKEKDKHQEYHRWYLYFENVKRIKPFEWEYGKQGVGKIPDGFDMDKLHFI